MEGIALNWMGTFLVSARTHSQVQISCYYSNFLGCIYVCYSGRQCERINPDSVCSYLSCGNGRCNSTRLRTADQSQLRALLGGQSVDSAVTPCECEENWEGDQCERCSLCDNPNADCVECE